MKILLVLSLSLASAFPAAAADEVVKSVSVRGLGEATVKPDLAKVTLEVRAKAKDAKSAQAKNAQEMSRVQKVLTTEFKVDGKDVRTTGFSLNADYSYEQKTGKQVFQGYVSSHSLSFTLRQLDKLGGVLDGLVGGKGDEVSVNLGGVEFDSSRRQEVELITLENGMKNAHARAEALAKFAKRSLKGVLRISDSSVRAAPPPFFQSQAKMEVMAASDRETQLSPGEIDIKANVAVDYELD